MWQRMWQRVHGLLRLVQGRPDRGGGGGVSCPGLRTWQGHGRLALRCRGTGHRVEAITGRQTWDCTVSSGSQC